MAYEINAYTEKPNELIAAYSRLMEQILNAFGDAGIEILSPQHVALRDSTPTSGPTVCMRCPQNRGRSSFGDDYLTVIQDRSLRSALGEGV